MSVFTYDPNPPRVSSPWLRPADATCQEKQEKPAGIHGLLSEYGVTKLPPEPQEGPVEYKLHLLLRPRKAYKPLTSLPGSLQAKLAADAKYLQKARVAISSTAGQTRQDRCQHLTTQLLWRLRQSSPYHASVAHQDIEVPLLPEDAAIASLPVTLGRLAPGLEESRGALYEIGVADDGSLVGITKDEMDQSIATLRWMAANLGCVSEVQRLVVVGECEWPQEVNAAACGEPSAAPRRENLWVAEIFVRPQMNSSGSDTNHSGLGLSASPDAQHFSTTLGSATTNQLRVTLTGPTGSGKSTLLGTLSTGALDDGHGKGRLNSLKHRHELASGLTSTVTQELLGYTDDGGIVNYANPNIESWIGIHDYTRDGRLVFVSDSAGHPRFRRTTLRGLIGWAPHWSLLCLGAAVEEEAVVGTLLPVEGGMGGCSAALAKAHLDLCLKLDLPLVVIITKSDLLNKESLKRTLVPIWTAVKNAGRAPRLLQSKQKSPENMRTITAADTEVIRQALLPAQDTGDFRATVPVILTSTVSGDGIGLVHALLQALPLPPTPMAQDYVGLAVNPEAPETLFHIEDRFSRPASYASVVPGQLADPGHVVSGYLRYGRLAVGDRVVIGPFPSDEEATGGGSGSLDDDRTASPSNHGGSTSMSHPSNAELSRIAARNAISASALQGEWYEARIVSIRNLRLPVETLEAGQVGTIGLVIQPEGLERVDIKPRRGMVLAVPSRHMRTSGLAMQAASGLTAFFADTAIESLAIGTPVTFYVASVRAQGRVCKIWSGSSGSESLDGDVDETEDGATDGGIFALHEPVEGMSTSTRTRSSSVSSSSSSREMKREVGQGYNVRLELLYRQEWIELGAQIVILEGASKEMFLLDGFIGKVVEISD